MLDGHWRVKAVISGMVWRLADFFLRLPAEADRPHQLPCRNTARLLNRTHRSIFHQHFISLYVWTSHRFYQPLL